MSDFNDRFDHSDDPTDTRNVYKLTATGCMQRHNIPRDEMMNTKKENITRNFEYRNRAEREETYLLNKVATLFSMGYKLSAVDAARAEVNGTDALAEFVERIENDIEREG